MNKTRRALSFSVIALLPLSLFAADTTADSGLSSDDTSIALSWLQSLGITPGFYYVAEFFSNLQGGHCARYAPEYLGNFLITAEFDSSRLGLKRGGHFFLSVQNDHGRSINSRHIGAYQPLSNLDAQPFTHVGECWFAQEWIEGKVKLKGGYLYSNSDFALTETANPFLNASFGLPPVIPMTAYPDPAWGAMVETDYSANFSIAAGLYQAPRQISDEGEQTGAQKEKRNPFAVLEVRRSPLKFRHGWTSPLIKAGIWKLVERNKNENSASQNHAREGAYFILEKPPKRSTQFNRTIDWFMQWGLVPRKRMAWDWYSGAGLHVKGAVKNRPQDIVGSGFAHAVLPMCAGRQSRTAETALEVFYLVRLDNHWFLQPDLQWVFNAEMPHRRAFATGLRLGVSF